jgi:hypothetical protein
VDGHPANPVTVRNPLPGLYRIVGSCENRPINGPAEELPMDKKAKTPKKPKQNKAKDGAAKGK